MGLCPNLLVELTTSWISCQSHYNRRCYYLWHKLLKDSDRWLRKSAMERNYKDFIRNFFEPLNVLIFFTSSLEIVEDVSFRQETLLLLFLSNHGELLLRNARSRQINTLRLINLSQIVKQT